MKMMNLNPSLLQLPAGAFYAVAALLLRTTTLNVEAVVVVLAFSADDRCHDDCSLEVAAVKRLHPCSGQKLRVDCNTFQLAS